MQLQRFNTMSEEQYYAALSDVAFWAPLLDLIARRERIPLTDAAVPVQLGQGQRS